MVTSNLQKKRPATAIPSSADEPPLVLSPARRARRCILTLLALLLVGVTAYVGLRDAPQPARLDPGADTPATASPEVPGDTIDTAQSPAAGTDSSVLRISAVARTSKTPAGRLRRQ